jgi:hypothetical protein
MQDSEGHEVTPRPRVVSAELDFELLAELVADRVAARLSGPGGREESRVAARRTEPRVLTARQVAERLGRSVEWVRDHRAELGLVHGSGPKPRLLFDIEAVDGWAHTRSQPTQPVVPHAHPRRRPRSQRRPLSGATELLPIRVESADELRSTG